MIVKGRVLIIAGSDSGGGAGIQADIKTVTALGGYACTAVTALTAQDTRGVYGVVGVEPEFISRQVEVVLADIGADCIKIGMLHTRAVIEAVTATLREFAPRTPLVVDPVMVAKGGARLLDADATDALVSMLFPLATLVTPNLPEAATILDESIGTVAEMERAAPRLRALGAQAVLLKGGHLVAGTVPDVLATDSGTGVLEHERLDTRNTHGTGCTLASAVATGLAQEMPLRDAVIRARAYVLEAMRRAPGFGEGHGPLDHGFRCGDRDSG